MSNNCWMQRPNVVGLTEKEQVVLSKLVEAWNLYLELGNHTDDDIQEFRDAIHRC